MHTFRIRLLRNLMFVLITLLTAAVLVNYIQKWRQRSSIVKPVREILSAELLRSANQIEYIAREDGKKKFRVLARKLVETRKGKAMLEGIEANDFNADGSERNHITSKSAEYDPDARQVFFSGDVRLRLGKDVLLRMETLHYSIGDQTGSSDDLLRLESPQASGTAQGVRYNEAQRRIELVRNLAFVIHRRTLATNGSAKSEDYNLTAGHGLYAEQQLSLVLDQGARLAGETGTLSGDRIEATFAPDRKRISSFSCQGNANYESRLNGDERTMRGDEIVFELNQATRALNKIHALGHAVFQLASAEGAQKLTAGEIHLDMDEAGSLPQRVESVREVKFEFVRGTQATRGESQWLRADFQPASNALAGVHVRDHASMKIGGTTDAADELRAEEIRFSFKDVEGKSVPQSVQAERSVQWTSPPRSPKEPGRTLTAAALMMRYSEKGDFMESGHASGGVTLNAVPAPGAPNVQVRRLQCDTADFGFYPGGNRLKSMAGDGNVKVFYRKPVDSGERAGADEYRTTSDTLRAHFRDADGTLDTLNQSGNFVFQDGTRTARAGNCDYSESTQKMVLTDHPGIVDPDSTTNGERIEYDRSGKEMVVRGKVRSILKSSSGTGQGVFSSQDASSPAVVDADEMRYWSEQAKAQYSGNVLMRSTEHLLRSQVLVISNRGDSVEAEGAVKHIIQNFSAAPGQKLLSSRPEPTNREGKAEAKSKPAEPMTIYSTLLQYGKSTGRIHYSGAVKVVNPDYTIQSDSFDVYVDADGKKVTRAKADGSVIITQPVRELRGSSADYDPITGVMVLTGNPAICRDFAQKDKTVISRSPRLTFYTTDGRILLN